MKAAMEAGIELDALVAEKVMAGVEGSYSTNLVDALRVFDTLVLSGMCRVMRLFSPGVKDTWTPVWVVSCWSQILADKYGHQFVDGMANVIVEGETAPHAICLASLRASGHDAP